MNYKTLRPAALKSLIRDTAELRIVGRFNEDFAIFIQKWPFLTEENGLRMELKQIKGLKNLEALKLRINRALKGNNVTFWLIVFRFNLQTRSRRVARKVKRKWENNF